METSRLNILPFHNKVMALLELQHWEKKWITNNPDNPFVQEWALHFISQSANYDKGRFFMLEGATRSLRAEIRKQLDEESFARDASL